MFQRRREVLRLVDGAVEIALIGREVVPFIGLDPLYGEDHLALRDRGSYVVHRPRGLENDVEYHPGRAPGIRVLRIKYGLPAMRDRFYDQRFFAWSVAPPLLRWDKQVHSTYALAVLLPRTLRRAHGRQWVEEQLRTLPALSATIVHAAYLVARRLRAMGPSRAALAYDAARASRASGDLLRSDTLFRAAADEAERAQHPKYVALALIGRATLHRRQGRPEDAEALLRQARTAAQQGACLVEEGMACQDLMCLASDRAVAKRDAAAAREVESLALAALEAYGGQPVKVARLALDIGNHLLNSCRFDDALSVFTAASPYVIDQESAALITYANIMYAAAHTDADAEFHRALAATRLYSDTAESSEGVAYALSWAAEAAFVYGDLDTAVQFANEAMTLAEETNETETLERSASVLRMIKVAAVTPRRSRGLVRRDHSGLSEFAVQVAQGIARAATLVDS